MTLSVDTGGSRSSNGGFGATSFPQPPEHWIIQGDICNDRLESFVFGLEFFESFGILSFRPALPILPAATGGLGHFELACEQRLSLHLGADHLRRAF